MHALIWPARIVSVAFHPLTILSYTLLFFLSANPYAFGVNRMGDMTPLIIMVVATTLVIPAVAVVLMRFLDLVDDIQLRQRMQRVGPYIAAGIFYAWMTRNVFHNEDIPPVFAAICLGCTFAIYACFVINIKFKISLHAVGAAGMTAIFILLYMHYPYSQVFVHIPQGSSLGISLMTMTFFSVLLAGLIGTARLILGIHRSEEIYWGYLVGFASPFIGMHLHGLFVG
jgi:hypothetical protein